jgi:UDP-GlcNAc:undecaprenyl-phosphate GlcNAc-1-phosphate transferase
MVDRTPLTVLAAAVLSFACLGLLLPLLRRWSPDVPDARSSHSAPIPRGAGLAVVLVVAGLTLDSPSLRMLIAFMGVLTLVGFLDDLVSLPARVRLIAQTLAAAAVTWWIASVASPAVTILFVGVGTLFVVGYINAFNFMDGINGISGVTAVVAGGWYAIHLARVGQPEWSLFATALAGACLGFLPWNVPRARGFLGDAGSYGIGAALAALAVGLGAWGASPAVILAPVLLYIADTLSTMLTRRRAGHGWADPHRGHVYQRLVDDGRSHVQVTAIVGTTLVVCCLAALAPVTLLGLALQCCAVGVYLALPRILAPRTRAIA